MPPVMSSDSPYIAEVLELLALLVLDRLPAILDVEHEPLAAAALVRHAR